MDKAEKLQSLFGVNIDDIQGHALEEPDYPDVTPGRVLHIDGDFLAYQVAADDSKSLATMMHNHDIAVETLRLLAGAETTVSHLTASHGNKGNRFELAIQKEYQSNRKGKVKPKHLHTMKSWMETQRGAMNHEIQEADDGLCQANWNAIQKDESELSVLVSKDKDLQMCQGFHLDWDTGELEEVNGFGYVTLDRSKSSPKIVGKGNAYFWAQMLTGDSADSIQGLPFLTGARLNEFKPTKVVKDTLEKLKHSSTPVQRSALQKKLDARKPGKCGPVIAFDILQTITTDKEAFDFVKTLYSEYDNFVHWDTGEAVPWQKVFVSEAQLLWMRRKPDDNDVLHYFKECV